MAEHEEVPQTVWNTRLDEMQVDYWANAILMRLAAAMGYVDPFDPDRGPVVVDPDELLEEAEFRIRWAEGNSNGRE